MKSVTENIERSRILLVEDEETLAFGLEYNLVEEGYKVDWARDGKEALKYFESTKYDMIVLDIMLPYYNGFEIAEKVRATEPQMPILMLTAKTDSKDRVKGLEMGADDYLTKPFNLQELLLRIKGMLKRKTWYKEVISNVPCYSIGTINVNFDTLEYTSGDTSHRLTHHEAMVLKYLIDKKGKIVSRQELLEQVWHVSSEIETRTVDNFIARLRKHFEVDPANPVYIKSVRSAGYCFSDE